MAQSWDDVFEKQSKKAANIDLCWIDKKGNKEKPKKKTVTPMYGGGSGFAMPMAIMRK